MVPIPATQVRSPKSTVARHAASPPPAIHTIAPASLLRPFQQPTVWVVGGYADTGRVPRWSPRTSYACALVSAQRKSVVGETNRGAYLLPSLVGRFNGPVPQRASGASRRGCVVLRAIRGGGSGAAIGTRPRRGHGGKLAEGTGGTGSSTGDRYCLNSRYDAALRYVKRCGAPLADSRSAAKIGLRRS
jgi:hypothetical protein